MKQLFVMATGLGLTLAACGDNTPGVTTVPAGSNCPNGGVAIESDSGTTYVCNGANGSDGANGSNATAFTWTTIDADTTAQAGYGYIADAASPITLTLPPTVGLNPGGDVKLIVHGAADVSVAPSSGQTFDYDPGQLGWRPAGAQEQANWGPIAMSADGTAIVAANWNDNDIYRSTDSGATWTKLAAPSTNVQAIASSTDGTVLVFVTWGSGVWFSTDSGSTWTESTSGAPGYSYSVAMSSDGSAMYATDYFGRAVEYSADHGATWTNLNAPSNYWQSITTTADGSAAIVKDYNGNVYRYDASGGTWTQLTSLPNNGGFIAASSDGMKLVAAIEGFGVYYSTDGATTWTQAAGVTGPDWFAAAISADGTVMYAAAYSNGAESGIVKSTDSGATWTLVDDTARNWQGIAVSADGAHPLATAVDGIYRNGDGSVLATHASELDLLYEGSGAFFATRTAGAAYGPY